MDRFRGISVSLFLCLLMCTFIMEGVAQAQQATGAASARQIEVSETEMNRRLVSRVAPDYPSMARAGEIQGRVILRAVVGKDGSVLGLQATSGNTLLVRAALESVLKWRYQPVLEDGMPVEVTTTITIDFALPNAKESSSSNPAAPPPLAITGTNNRSPTLIHLKNGRTITAESVFEDGAKIEYIVGNGTYEIPRSLVASIDNASGTKPGVSSSTSWNQAGSASATVAGQPLPSRPQLFGDDQKNWHLFDSTAQLRKECQNGEFHNWVHPEFQSTSNFPNPDEANQICLVLKTDMGGDYEKLVDRGVELNRILCSAGRGAVSTVRENDPSLASAQDEMRRITAEFNERMKNLTQDRTNGLRMMVDFYRIAGTCGHGL